MNIEIGQQVVILSRAESEGPDDEPIFEHGDLAVVCGFAPSGCVLCLPIENDGTVDYEVEPEPFFEGEYIPLRKAARATLLPIIVTLGVFQLAKRSK